MSSVIQPQQVADDTTVRRGGARKFRLTPYLFILPHFIFFVMFIGYPFFNGLYLSLFRYDYLQPATNAFVGLQNYLDLFTQGSVTFQNFWNSLWNTVQFVVYSVPLLVVLPLLLALLLNAKIPGVTVFRTIYFAPWVLSVSVVGLLWWWIFQSAGGLVNTYLTMWNLPAPEWLSTLPWAWVSIVIATIWWTMGFNMIILLAALQGIPTELYEAGSVDGANKWNMFWSLTLPMLRPILLFIVITSIIASFNLFGQPFIMTQGGPALPSGSGATTPVMYEIYNEGIVRHFVGSAAAMSLVVAVIMIVISYGNFRLFRERS
ncbi:glycerol-3-phosphate ABC transporter permease [Dictyobacter sp. S3.2.2.5]|uniref:Glycerol-3-phosphate ABC transporter permease n=1 Tax=Dictyobacter halimunensis TaxID=3026934 RepID=A0ABQ6G072_9CHLR|nr:glycerol-3-phosphate ABC transporter permease [Dictyobacter sp. S3.2.2.5]